MNPLQKAKDILKTERYKEIFKDAENDIKMKRAKILDLLYRKTPLPNHVDNKFRFFNDFFLLDTRKTKYDLGFILCIYINDTWHIFPTNKLLDIIKLSDLEAAGSNSLEAK